MTLSGWEVSLDTSVKQKNPHSFKDSNIDKGFESEFPTSWVIALWFKVLRKKSRDYFIYPVKKKLESLAEFCAERNHLGILGECLHWLTLWVCTEAGLSDWVTEILKATVPMEPRSVQNETVYEVLKQCNSA